MLIVWGTHQGAIATISPWGGFVASFLEQKQKMQFGVEKNVRFFICRCQ